jgi:hypothetical protein
VQDPDPVRPARSSRDQARRPKADDGPRDDGAGLGLGEKIGCGALILGGIAIGQLVIHARCF